MSILQWSNGFQNALQVLANLHTRPFSNNRMTSKRGTSMTRATDVAKYILEKTGPITALKLQKLVYYSQAWSLVWDDRPLFVDEIQAWRNGPVVRALFEQHKGKFEVTSSDIAGSIDSLDTLALETIDAVIRDYGGYSAQYLSDLTHMETPWQQARSGHTEDQTSTSVISHDAMADYYQNLYDEAENEES